MSEENRRAAEEMQRFREVYQEADRTILEALERRIMAAIGRADVAVTLAEPLEETR